MTGSLEDPQTLEDVKRQFHDKDGVLKDKLSINNSIAAHIRWRKQYKTSCEGRLAMLNSCPTQEAVKYLRVEWRKYEMKCQDIEVGTTILMELDPTVVKRIMAGVEEQSKEYSKLSSNMGRILTNLTRIQHDNRQPQRQQEPDKEPKIKKELCPDILTKDTSPIEFRKFQSDFIVYYKESYMERASPEGQKHFLLKCLDVELGERMLAITDATTPIFDTEGNPTKSCFALLKEEFHRRFPVTNRRKDFFLQSQGQQQLTAYIDELRNMAIEADLSNATAEDLIVVMGIVGCKDNKLRGDLQKLVAPKLADIIKLGEAHKRKTFAEKGFAVKANAVQATSGAKPKAKRTDNPVRRKEIERLMKGKCYRCGEGHRTDQCGQKGGSLKCTACNRKGHIAKA